MQLLRMTLQEPCMYYKKAFKDMDSAKLKSGGFQNTSRNYLLFTGTEGVEGLLQMKEWFDTVCSFLGFHNGQQKFNTFLQCIVENAEVCWCGVLNDVPAHVARNNTLFDECFCKYLQ